MSLPVGTVAVSIISTGAEPVWVKTPKGWQYMMPLTGESELSSHIKDTDFDLYWSFIKPENPVWEGSP